MRNIEERRVAFRQLHASGCFVIPNPYDRGTARYLRRLGFQALATSSAALAFSRGLPDADWAVPRDVMLGHIKEIVDATDLPVTADFESGYAHDPKGVAENVKLCIETGVAGLSIEDATADPAKPLYDLSAAADRIAAARAAIDASGSGVLLTARAEPFLVGHPDPFAEAVRRLQKYAEAGADVLYAPGVHKRNEIAGLAAAVHPKPLNVLMLSSALTVGGLGSLGVRRISLGSALARAAWGGFLRAATRLAENGDFSGFDGSAGYANLNQIFRDDMSESSAI